MKIETFKKIISYKDLKNFNELLQGMCAEHDISFEDICLVTDSKYENTRYMFSTVNNDLVHTNWFSYGVDENHLGLLRQVGGGTKLVSYIPCDYSKYIILANECWLCLKQDSYYDLYCYGNKILTNIVSYDVISLGDVLTCIQLDTTRNRFLVCNEVPNLNSGVYLPKSKKDFIEYFKNIVAKTGYQGMLDDVPLSAIMQFYYEVLNCIFSVGKFRSLEANCCE